MSKVDDRLREYANPNRRGNWQGSSSQMASIDRWSARAERLSDGPRHRAAGRTDTNGARTRELDPPELQSTGKKTELRSTEITPREPRRVNARMVD